MTTRLPVFLAFLCASPCLLVACADDSEAAPLTDPVSDEAAIVGGRPDRGHDLAVVAIAIGDDALCTGSLIAPDVVLTARHCVSVTAEAIDCESGQRQLVSDRDPATLTVLVGDDITTATPVARGASLLTPTGTTLCEHDIALVKLDRAVEGVTPLRVGASLDDDTRLRAVGFGQRRDDGPAGRKFVKVHVPVLGASASELMVGEVTCHGDSGGPAIDEATGHVVGVLSRGGPGCQGPDTRNIYTRPGAFASLLRRAGVSVAP